MVYFKGHHTVPLINGFTTAGTVIIGEDKRAITISED